MQEHNLFIIFTGRLHKIKVDYMITGSVAGIIYGEPRLTHDVDLIVMLHGSDDARRLVQIFPLEEFYCPPTEVIRAELNRGQRGHFNIIHHESGYKADIYLMGNDPFHAWAFARRRHINFLGHPLFIAPPEYVIVRKLEYYREGLSEKHLRDIAAMVRVSGDNIDYNEIDRLTKERGLEKFWPGQFERNTQKGTQ